MSYTPPLRMGPVARQLGVSRQTVRNWCLAGRIRFVLTPAGEHRIPADEVDRILGGGA